jgi:hypothetical protein
MPLVFACLVFRPGQWQLVHYGRWRRGLAWAMPAWSGLGSAGGVWPGCGRMSAWAGAECL